MQIQTILFRFFVLAGLIGTVACSSGGSGSSSSSDDDTTETVVAPVFTSVIPGDGQVTLTWTHVDEPTTDVTDGAPVLTYNLYYANATANDTTIDELLATYTEVEDIVAVDGYQAIEGIDDLSYTVDGLDNENLYYFILTAVDLQLDESTEEEDDYIEVESDASASEAYAMPRISAFRFQPLADTGVTLCGDYTYGVEAQDLDDDGVISLDELDVDGDEIYLEHDNRIDCAAQDDDQDPIPAVAQQDASQGFDALAADDADGIAGFSYTKLDQNGLALAADAPSWSCVQDNITGLIWEAKSYTDVEEDEDLHHSKDLFSWYNADTTLNGEEEGFQVPSNAAANDDEGDDICFGYTDGDETTYCNTSAFVDRVNDEALCGYTDWRLPDLTELRSLVNYGAENEDASNLVASVDSTFFPNMEIDGGIEGSTIDGGIRYWSSQTYAFVPTAAWSIYYGYGGAPPLNKGTPNSVRLVRSDP